MAGKDVWERVRGVFSIDDGRGPRQIEATNQFLARLSTGPSLVKTPDEIAERHETILYFQHWPSLLSEELDAFLEAVDAMPQAWERYLSGAWNYTASLYGGKTAKYPARWRNPEEIVSDLHSAQAGHIDLSATQDGQNLLYLLTQHPDESVIEALVTTQNLDPDILARAMSGTEFDDQTKRHEIYRQKGLRSVKELDAQREHHVDILDQQLRACLNLNQPQIPGENRDSHIPTLLAAARRGKDFGERAREVLLEAREEKRRESTGLARQDDAYIFHEGESNVPLPLERLRYVIDSLGLNPGTSVVVLKEYPKASVQKAYVTSFAHEQNTVAIECVFEDNALIVIEPGIEYLVNMRGLNGNTFNQGLFLTASEAIIQARLLLEMQRNGNLWNEHVQQIAAGLLAQDIVILNSDELLRKRNTLGSAVYKKEREESELLIGGRNFGPATQLFEEMQRDGIDTNDRSLRAKWLLKKIGSSR